MVDRFGAHGRASTRKVIEAETAGSGGEWPRRKLGRIGAGHESGTVLGQWHLGTGPLGAVQPEGGSLGRSHRAVCQHTCLLHPRGDFGVDD